VATVPDLVDERTPPADAPADLVGRKGHELTVLASCATSGAFRAPRFRIVPASLCRSFHDDAGRPTPPGLQRRPAGAPVLRFPDLPGPHLIAPDVQRHYEPFAARHAETLARAVAGLGDGRPVVLRSSVVAPVPPAVSMAGVNFTVHEVGAGEAHIGAAVTRLLAAMWRPYAEWYLSRHARSGWRHAALMVCELIDLALAGTAHVHRGRIFVDYGVPGPTPMPVRGDLALTLTDRGHRWRGWWRERGRGERLREGLAALTAQLELGHSPVEVEFGFDRDDNLFFIQHRAMPALAPDTSALALRHSSGSVTGRLVSLLDRPRTIRAMVEALRASDEDRIWAVHQVNDSRWDGFALLWFLSRHLPGAGVRAVLCHDGVPVRTHLVAAMHEDPTLRFVAQLPASAVTPLPDGALVTATSDGVTASIDTCDLRPGPLERSRP
jgi:hypothetical protein